MINSESFPASYSGKRHSKQSCKNLTMVELHLLHHLKGAWSLSNENRGTLAWLVQTMWNWKFEFWIKNLLNVRTTDISSFNFSHFDNLDRSESRSVTRSHVLVAAYNGSSSSYISVFLVHVVGTRARVVSNPDSKCFHGGGLLFKNLIK